MKALLMGWIVLVFSTPHALWAQEQTALEPPNGSVILKVTGEILHANTECGGKAARFDRDMLQALPQHAFRTNTPWTEGASDYSGPLMRTLLEHLGASGKRLHVKALNGYEATIPVDDFYDYDVILALERDQRAIPIREYGPLWVLYPFYQDDKLLSEKIRFRAVWQVMQIHVH